MAYFVDYTVQQSTAGATSVNVTLPAHQTNDILVVFWTQDATTTASMTNWTQIGTTQQPTGHSAAMFWKRAASAAETGTLSLGAADAHVIRSFCIRDVDTTTAVDASITNLSNTAASQFNSEVITTTTTDCFILYCHSLEGIAVATHSDPGVHFIHSSDSLGTNATTSAASGSAWYIQRDTGNVPTPGWRCSLSGTRANFTVAFRNKSGGRIPPYIDDVSTPIALVAGHHFSTLNGISFPGTITLNNIGPGGTGKAATTDAAAAVADFGINPYSSALSSTPATTASTSVAGFEVALNPTVDLTNRFFVGYAIASTPRQATFDHGSVSEGGTYMVFASGATANTNYRSYQVLARDAATNTVGRGIFSVNPNQTTTAFGTNGTYSSSATTKLLFLSNNPTATITLYTSDWCAVEKLVIAGGDANFPVDSDGVFDIGSSFRIPVIDLRGSSGLLSFVPLQIGGSDAVNFQIDGGSLQFPRIYNTTTKEINFHAADNTTGISYAGKSGDTVKHTNSVVTSESPYYWEINTAATNAATWDFTGLTIVGANVTLRNVTTFDKMTFSECLTIATSGCTITNGTFSKTVASSLTMSSTTSITNSSFDTSTIAAGAGLTTVTLATKTTGGALPISNSTFTGTSSSGHAIIITEAGTYSFSGVTFTGYGGTPGDNNTSNSGSTSAAVYNNSGGAVIIQVSGGTQPSVRNGAGATTDVQASADVVIDGLVAGSEVRAYTGTDPATAVEIAGTENSTGTSYTFTQSAAGVQGYIHIFHLEYQPIFRSLTYSGSNQTITVQQIKDRQFDAGSVP